MTEPFDHDDELLARLRAADPASSLTPVPPEGVARLLEDAMSHDVLTESRESGTHGRSLLTWLVAAAAVVLIAAAGAFVFLGSDDDVAPIPAVTEPTVTELQAPDPSAYEARCMVPNAAVLSGRTTAFSGTVDDIDGEVVTLTPDRWYAGTPTDLVTVTAPGAQLEALLSAVSFEDGERYLVAADEDGRVMVCGFSAAWSEDLAAVYAEAFPS